MGDVMRNGDLSVGARLLWWELTQWASDDLPTCYPPQTALTENLGVSRSSIQRWAQELVEHGLIKVVPGQRGNGYMLQKGARGCTTSARDVAR